MPNLGAFPYPQPRTPYPWPDYSQRTTGRLGVEPLINKQIFFLQVINKCIYNFLISNNDIFLIKVILI